MATDRFSLVFGALADPTRRAILTPIVQTSEFVGAPGHVRLDTTTRLQTATR